MPWGRKEEGVKVYYFFKGFSSHELAKTCYLEAIDLNSSFPKIFTLYSEDY